MPRRLSSLRVLLALFAVAVAACATRPAPPATAAATPPPAAARPEPATPPAPPAPPSDGASAPAKLDRRPDVVYVPTPEPVVDKMLELARVKQTDVLYDLGCGDGRIVVTAAKRYGVKAVGYDIDPVRVAEARTNVKKNQVEHLVTIEQRDIFTLDLSQADVITLYLLPRLNVRLIPQLDKLKPGSRIVSHDFDMAGVVPEKHIQMSAGTPARMHQIFLFETPLPRAR